MKKRIALLLAVVMLISILPMNVFAVTDTYPIDIMGAGPWSAEEDTVFTMNASPQARELVLRMPTISVAGAGNTVNATDNYRMEFTINLSGATWVNGSNGDPVASNGTWGAGWDFLKTGAVPGPAGLAIGASGKIYAATDEVSNKDFVMTRDNYPANGLTTRVSVYPHATNTATVAVFNTVADTPMPILQNTDLKIPLVCKVTTDNSDVKVTSVVPTLSTTTTAAGVAANNGFLFSTWPGTYGNYVIARGSTEGKTKATAQGKPISKFTFNIDRLVIEELLPGSFVGGGTFYIDAPDNFVFATKTGGWSSYGVNMNGATIPQAALVQNSKGRDNARIVVTMPVAANINSNVLCTLVIQNIELVSIYGAMGEFSLKLSNASGTTTVPVGGLWTAGIKAETIQVGTRSNWSVTFDRTEDPASDSSMTMDALPKLFTGRYDINKTMTWADGDGKLAQGSFEPIPVIAPPNNIADEFNDALFSDYFDYKGLIKNDSLSNRVARLTFKEEVLRAWLENRETVFTLPTGVKFLRVDFAKVDGLAAGAAGIAKGTSFYNNYKDVSNLQNGATNIVIVNDQTMEWYNLARKTDTEIEIELDIWVSIEADFAPADGSAVPIEMTISGDAVPAGMDAVTIAMAQRPITIDTKVTEVSIGYQRIPTADVTIKETEAGVLREDMRVSFAMEAPLTGGIGLQEGSAIAVTNGDLEIRNAKAWSGFNVDAESTEASTVKLTNMAIYIDRTVAYSNDRAYNFLVYGEAVIRNGLGTEVQRRKKGLFGTDAFEPPYATVTTASTDFVTAEIRVGIGNSYYTVDGKKFDMTDGAAYISDGNTMVPLRFVSYALGIAKDDIIWDNETKQAFIRSPKGTVVFEANSSYMIVDGVKLPMVNGSSNVKAELVAGRLYIPFRQIGIAFGIKVDWDAETKEAIYNPQNAK